MAAASSSPRVVVTHYTDPWSVWCWAIEPQMRRLRERHGDAIEFRVRLGAIHEVPAPPDFPRREIARMFQAARRQSGMPLDPNVVLESWPGTTHRAGIAVRAAMLAAPGAGERFLRRVREAAMVDGLDVEDLAVQESIAKETGVDGQAFREALESEEATREFYSDQAEGRVRGVSGFPTVTFRGRDGMEVGVAGFQPTEAYEAAMARVTGAAWVDEPAPDLRAFLRRAGRVATAEVAEVYDWLEDAATVRLLDLEREGAVRRVEKAGGFFWEAR